MKHRTRAVAPDVRASRRPARRLAARLLVTLAALAAAVAPVRAGSVHPPAERSTPMAAVTLREAAAGFPAPVASSGNEAPAKGRGASATAHPHTPIGAARPAVAGAVPAVDDDSPGRSLPEPRIWALFGVGLLAVLMMGRRQRQQHR